MSRAPQSRRRRNAALASGSALLSGLVALVRDVARAELLALSHGVEADAWVSHRDWPGCTSARAAIALAKSGAIEGVRVVGQGRGRAYLARRSAIEAWITAEHEKNVDGTAPADGSASRERRAGGQR